MRRDEILADAVFALARKHNVENTFAYPEDFLDAIIDKISKKAVKNWVRRQKRRGKQQ